MHVTLKPFDLVILLCNKQYQHVSWNAFLQGYYCLSVTVSILPWTGLLMPGSVAVPTRELSTTQLVRENSTAMACVEVVQRVGLITMSWRQLLKDIEEELDSHAAFVCLAQ
jgi:hypothetical protein